LFHRTNVQNLLLKEKCSVQESDNHERVILHRL
jgi:hypothetical protein